MAGEMKKVQGRGQEGEGLPASREDALTGERTDALPKYVLAAWKLEAKRLEKADAPAADRERREDSMAPLDRLTRYLAKKNTPSSMNDWDKHLPKKAGASDPPDEVKMADAFRDQVKEAVASRRARPTKRTSPLLATTASSREGCGRSFDDVSPSRPPTRR